jgi:hypothetical protein
VLHNLSLMLVSPFIVMLLSATVYTTLFCIFYPFSAKRYLENVGIFILLDSTWLTMLCFRAMRFRGTRWAHYAVGQSCQQTRWAFIWEFSLLLYSFASDICICFMVCFTITGLVFDNSFFFCLWWGISLNCLACILVVRMEVVLFKGLLCYWLLFARLAPVLCPCFLK